MGGNCAHLHLGRLGSLLKAVTLRASTLWSYWAEPRGEGRDKPERGLASHWLSSWLTAWAIAFPIALVAAPLARRVVAIVADGE
jgi:hypothetical protein